MGFSNEVSVDKQAVGSATGYTKFYHILLNPNSNWEDMKHVGNRKAL